MKRIPIISMFSQLFSVLKPDSAPIQPWGLLVFSLIIGMGVGQPVRGQVPQNEIAEGCEACRAQDVYAADLNGDDDLDILFASALDDKIAWYENNGDGTFSDQKVITTNAKRSRSVYAADLTGNGDVDVLSATEGKSGEGSEIAWYKNKGNGTFSKKKIITTEVEGARSVYAADLNGDDDLDVLSASEDFSNENNKIAWYRNNGDGTFSDQKIITTGTFGVKDVHAADLTGNGDPDVIFAASGSNRIAWHRNDDGTFSDQKIIANSADSPHSVYAEDLNKDDHVDVLAASEGGFGKKSKIAWYKNNGDGSFSTETVITEDVVGARSVHAADLTGDESIDVLSASLDGKIAWYENTEGVLPVELVRFDATTSGETVQLSWRTASEINNASFRVQRRIDGGMSERDWEQVGRVAGGGTTTDPQSYRFRDANLPDGADTLAYRLKQVDTDGSVNYSDVVTVQREVTELTLSAPFPNPAGEQFTIRYALPEVQTVTLRLYDVLGREVRTVEQGTAEGRQTRQVDLSELSSGTYFLRLEAGGQVRTEQVTVVR